MFSVLLLIQQFTSLVFRGYFFHSKVVLMHVLHNAEDTYAFSKLTSTYLYLQMQLKDFLETFIICFLPAVYATVFQMTNVVVIIYSFVVIT